MIPNQIIRLAPPASGNITGGGLPTPSVEDITPQIYSNPDWAIALDPPYLWSMVYYDLPRSADSFYSGDQYWTEGTSPYLGSYDPTKPRGAPGQDPKLVVVHGDLQLDGKLAGAGLLVVTGDFTCTGPYSYIGLILVIGSGHVSVEGSGDGITGTLFVAALTDSGGGSQFGIPSFSIGANSRFAASREAVRMALGLVPVSQISFREIAGSDP
jgi:hypothetical protein